MLVVGASLVRGLEIAREKDYLAHIARLQADFRGLWPEFETPNELAAQLVRQLDERAAAKDAASLATRLVVSA